MSEKNLGNSFSWFLAEVVDVHDPDQAGRVQIRVFGRHDDKTNIPDKDLPWALPVQDITSASIGRIGSAPVGLVKSSKVVGFWADHDQQYPVLMGGFGKAGDAVPGQTVNGAEKVDLTKGSIPAPAQTLDNAAPTAWNPYSKLYKDRKTLDDINSGIADVTSLVNTTGIINHTAVNQLLGQPTKPTIVGFAKGDLRDVLDLVKKVDPQFASSVLPKLTDAFIAIRKILGISSPAGITGMLTGSLQSMISNLAQSLGIGKIMSLMQSALASGGLNQQAFQALTQAVSSVQAELQSTGSVAPSNVPSSMEIIDPVASIPSPVVDVPSPGYVQQFYDGVLQQNPYPGYNTWVFPLTGDTQYTINTSRIAYASSDDMLVGNSSTSLQGAVSTAASSGASGGDVASIINNALASLQSSALQSVLGSNISLNTIMSMATQLIPALKNILGGLEATLESMIGGKFGALFGALVGPPNPKPVSDSMNQHVAHQAQISQIRDNAQKAVSETNKPDQAPAASTSFNTPPASDAVGLGDYEKVAETGASV